MPTKPFATTGKNPTPMASGGDAEKAIFPDATRGAQSGGGATGGEGDGTGREALAHPGEASQGGFAA